jgi:hypothetical protein
MQFLGSTIVSSSCVLCGIKDSDRIPLSFERNLREVLSIFAVWSDTFVAGSIRKSPVAAILRPRAFPKILAAIVQRVVVAMVAFFISRTAKNKSVHFYPAIPYRIKTLSTFAPKSYPIPLINPFIVFRINERVLSLREGNNLVGLVQRLRNFMSADMSFHGSTSDGIVMQPLFYHEAA